MKRRMKCNLLIAIAIVLVFGVSAVYGTEWCVQVSTYRNLEGIKGDFQKIKGHHGARIEKINEVYSLRTGFYGSEAQAKAALKSLKGEFPKAFVRTCADMPERIIESSQPPKAKRSVKGKDREPSSKPKEKTSTKEPASKQEKQIAAKPKDDAKKKSQPAAKEPPPAAKEPPPAAPFVHTMKPAEVPSAAPPRPPIPAEAAPRAAAPPPEKPAADVAATPSPSAPEDARQLFAEADKQRGLGRYLQALDLYKKAAEKSAPDSDLAGRAAYRAAFCRDATGERRMAEAEYAQAIEKWPGLDNAPEHVLFNEGMKAYKEGRYDKALKIFAAYGTGYPNKTCQADFMMACALMRMERYRTAMMLFDRVIGQYPHSSEAVESMVALGNIGLLAPKMRVGLSSVGYDCYMDPIGAYDRAIKLRSRDWTNIEHIVYAKGYALWKQGRHEEAHKALMQCVQSYRSSSQSPAYRSMTAQNIIPLLKMYYGREDYASVVGAYFQVTGQDVVLLPDVETSIMIGNSLHRMGLFEDAVNFLKAARIKLNGKDADEIGKVLDNLGTAAPNNEKVCEAVLNEYREVQGSGKAPAPGLALRAADCLYQGKQYADCVPIYGWAVGQELSPDEKRWALLRMGQAHLRSGKEDEAKKALDQLKAFGADEFWMKLADFAYEDGKWTEKYKKVIKNR